VKISTEQVRAALEAYVKTKRGKRTESGDSAAESGAPVDGLQRRLHDMPDERDIIVHDLRTKVRHGAYFVPSRAIVDALLGRLTADLLEE
jgi:anti-sigma28 factor (negative regulator of flagellin synthesis)